MFYVVVLENDNFFEWVIIYFGCLMINFDGGVLCIKMNFSLCFFQEQFWVKFEMWIFYYYIVFDGIVCYWFNLSKLEDVMLYIEVIFLILEEDELVYDLREIVNFEVMRLYWGGFVIDKK